MLTEEEKNAGLMGRIIPINIEEQMKSAYIDYSMSVIVSRALPDVRDGLKPVHRRILYDMSAELFPPLSNSQSTWFTHTLAYLTHTR